MIYVCGESFIDRYQWGAVTRISPDAPVPVILIDRVEDREGGAANVANNIRSLSGEQCFLIEPDCDRIIKSRVLVAGHHFCRMDYDFQMVDIGPEPIMDMVEPGDIVVFIDYGKGGLRRVSELIEASKAEGALVLVDPKGHDWSKYRGADLIKPNRDEAKELVGGWSSTPELVTKMRAALKKHRIGAALITLAEKGAVLVMTKGSMVVKGQKIDAVCHSGAGEAAISAYAVALQEGLAPEDAAHYAVRAGEQACKQFGTVILERGEVFEDDRGAEGSAGAVALAH